LLHPQIASYEFSITTNVTNFTRSRRLTVLETTHSLV